MLEWRFIGSELLGVLGVLQCLHWDPGPNQGGDLSWISLFEAARRGQCGQRLNEAAGDLRHAVGRWAERGKGQGSSWITGSMETVDRPYGVVRTTEYIIVDGRW